MLADCFRLAKRDDLMAHYRDAAIEAYDHASGLADMMLEQRQGLGNWNMSGKDFRITAAAHLYNVTGDTRFENDLNNFSVCKTPASTVFNPDTHNEIFACAAYLLTPQKVNYPELQANMKSSVIAEAKAREANYTQSRPSRRSTDNGSGWFVTVIDTQRSILAHAISEGADKAFFEDALILEADFSLGRNPMGMIHMTTATTGMENKRSMENAYTTGWNDGTPGVHPGHTPYMNIYDWGGMIMGRPKWMTDKNFPAAGEWPYGEMYYNTRYVYAHSEFTPQQTMGGKTALYGYLHAINKK